MLRKYGRYRKTTQKLSERRNRLGLSPLSLNCIIRNELSSICIKFTLGISSQKMILKNDQNLRNGLFVNAKITFLANGAIGDEAIFSINATVDTPNIRMYGPRRNTSSVTFRKNDLGQKKCLFHLESVAKLFCQGHNFLQ